MNSHQKETPNDNSCAETIEVVVAERGDECALCSRTSTTNKGEQAEDCDGEHEVAATNGGKRNRKIDEDISAFELHEDGNYSMMNAILCYLKIVGLLHIPTLTSCLSPKRRDDPNFQATINSQKKAESSVQNGGHSLKKLDEEDIQGGAQKQESSWASICQTLHRIYCILTLILLWQYLFRHLASFYKGSNKHDGLLVIIDKVSVASWITLAASSATSIYRAGTKKSRLLRFFHAWSQYSEVHSSEKLKKCFKAPMWIAILFSTSGVVINNLFWMIPAYFYQEFLTANPGLESCFIDPVVEPFYSWTHKLQNHTTNYTALEYLNDHPFLAVHTYVIFTYTGFAWLVTPAVFYLFCFILEHQMKLLQKIYDDVILRGQTLDGKELYKTFEHLRVRHAALCDIIGIVDKIFNGFIFSCFMCNLVMACCNSYILFDFFSSRDKEWITLIPVIWWLVCSVLHLSLICVGSGKVNESVYAFYDSVYSTSFLKNAPPEMLHKVGMFLQRLSSSSVGFTAWNLYVVDKGSVLTIASTFLAYVVVLLTLPHEMDLT